MPRPAINQDQEGELISAIEMFVNDPLGFVYFVYPWEEKGTILEKESGPDKWQTRVLTDLGNMLKDPQERPSAYGPIQIAASSGHGVGKTALISWIIHWFMSTHPYPQIPVTSNTKEQLLAKTWRELAKWHNLSINKHWFKWTATRFINNYYPETWFAHAIPWSKERSEAFAGTHEKYVLMIFDEASAIEDIIWEVAEGAMTTPDAIWVVFGNMTRNTGKFFQCFHKFRHRWRRYTIDSRDAKKADHDKINQWIEDYGEDSDFVRVRVKGTAPRAGMMQFIPSDLIEKASQVELIPKMFNFAPKIIGVDVARFGDDQSIIIKRQGLKCYEPKKFRNIDTMRFASIISEEIKSWEPDAVFVDSVGIGAGVVDRLKQLNYDVVEVNAGETAINQNKYYNKRAEIWARMRDWLKSGAQIPNDLELKDDLAAPEYGFDSRERVQLEKKKDMKDRGLPSPDNADALSLTFAENVVVDDTLKPIKYPDNYGRGAL